MEAYTVIHGRVRNFLAFARNIISSPATETGAAEPVERSVGSELRQKEIVHAKERYQAQTIAYATPHRYFR